MALRVLIFFETLRKALFYADHKGFCDALLIISVSGIIYSIAAIFGSTEFDGKLKRLYEYRNRMICFLEQEAFRLDY